MNNIYLQKFLFVLSIISHPVFLPICLMIWYLYFAGYHYPMSYLSFYDERLKLEWLLLYAAFFSVIPMLILFILQKLHLVHDIYIENTRDRKIYFLLIAIYYWAMFYQFHEFYLKALFRPSVVIIEALAFVFLILSFICSFNFNISLHATGYGILAAFFVSLSIVFKELYWNEIIICIILSVLVMLIRLILKKHDFFELLSGWAIGLFLTIFIYLYEYQYKNL